MVMYSRYRQMTWLDILSKIEDDVDKWIYVTALRSCDIPCVAIKTLFAGFLRGRDAIGVHAYIDIEDFEELIIEGKLSSIAYGLIEEAKDLVNNSALIHYMDHVINALEVINKYLEEYVSRRLQDIAVILFRQEWDRVNDVVKLLKEIREYILRELGKSILKEIKE